ncbi:MAG: methyltransferase domain-containing protein [Acidimicrobiia bacterium]
MPDVYSHGHHDSVLRAHRWRTVANSAAYLEPWLTPGTTVLDVGCGPGTLSADMASLVHPGRFVAVDRAEDVLGEARAAAAASSLSNLEIAVGDVYALDFADATFDVVHAHQVLQHLSDPVAALREMRRVCRPGGVVAARDADYGGFRWFPENPGLDRWLEMYQAVARSNRAAPDAGRRLTTWAAEAGFTEVHATASAWCFADQGDRTWWGDLWAERVVSSSVATQAIDYALASRADLEAMAEAWRTWAQAPVGWLTITHGEIVATA